jgi:hypothetical protein
MKIILTDGTELNLIMVTGAASYVQGANRDTLSFIFPAFENMMLLDMVFSAANCETITIVGDDGSMSIHKAYTVRAKMEKSVVDVTPATPETEAVYEERITVAMAQRTYAESQLAALTDTVDVLVLENLMNWTTPEEEEMPIEDELEENENV